VTIALPKIAEAISTGRSVAFRAAGEFPTPAPPSWWLAEALAAEGKVLECPPLHGEATADVAIIGGGYTGLWTALALKERKPDLDIVVIEAEICGAGASGMNGGKVHGYWASLAGMSAFLGNDGALAVARAGARAQDALRAFAQTCSRDLWWREGGSLRVSASAGQDKKLDDYVTAAKKLGVPEMAVAVPAEDVQRRCASPVFRAGVYFPEGATVHPARLARALRAVALAHGIRIHERTRMEDYDPGPTTRIRFAGGQIIAREVVLATNVTLIGERHVRPHMTVFSSYALMTEAAPSLLAKLWPTEEGISDLRMFVHYFRKTPTGRVLMGSGSGPILLGSNPDNRKLTRDNASAGRAVAGLRRLLPGLAGVPVAKTWGGAIDVASDRLPFFGTLPGTRVHFGCGYSGHGVNATYIGGQCLASLVLRQKDEWSTLPLCTRQRPTLPPEPFRYLVGNAIRWGIMNCEAAEEGGHEGSGVARALAALPHVLGMRIGTR
jgi:glycine/D-amino acid oxidase-like deaminating enzyme